MAEFQIKNVGGVTEISTKGVFLQKSSRTTALFNAKGAFPIKRSDINVLFAAKKRKNNYMLDLAKLICEIKK